MDDHDLQRQTSLVKIYDHDLQRQTLMYKWMIMICRDSLSGTNGWS